MSPMPETSPMATQGDAGISSVSLIVDAIIDGVMRGHYAPGQRLIAADVADEYGVSRAPVREALHMLAGEGVVALIPNRGAKIRKLSSQELIDFLEFTEAICVLGVRLAAAKMQDPDCRKKLNSAYESIRNSWDRRNASDFVHALYVYHVALNEISGNKFLDFFYKRPYIRFYTLLLSELVPGMTWDQYIINYELVHDHITVGDSHSAAITFQSHIRWVLRNMRRVSSVGAVSSKVTRASAIDTSMLHGDN